MDDNNKKINDLPSHSSEKQKMELSKQYCMSFNNDNIQKLNKVIALFSIEESLILYNSIDAMFRSALMDTILGKIEKRQTNNILRLFIDEIYRNKIWECIKLLFKRKEQNGNNYQKYISQFVLTNFSDVKKFYFIQSKFLYPLGKDCQLFDNVDSLNKAKMLFGDLENFNQSWPGQFLSKGGSHEILYLIYSTFKTDSQGKYVQNRLGEPEFVDLKETWRSLLCIFLGKSTKTEMYITLLERSKCNPELKQIANELGNPEEEMDNQLKTLLWDKFFESFYFSDIDQTHIMSSYSYDIGMKPHLRQVKQNFKKYFNELNSSYTFLNSKGIKSLNVEKLLKHYTAKSIKQMTSISDKMVYASVIQEIIKNEINYINHNLILKESKLHLHFLKDIGFNLTERPGLLNELNRSSTFGYIFKKLVALYEAGIEISDPIEQLAIENFDDNMQLISGERGNVIKLLMLETISP